MTGVKFVVDDHGKKTAVMIDLKKHGDVWEDFYDSMIAEKRKDEPRETLEIVKAKLKKLGKL